MRSEKARELICTTHGHEPKGELLEGMGVLGGGGKGLKNGTTIIAWTIKYT